MSEQMEAVAAMQFKVGSAVRACREIPPNVEQGDIGFVVAVYAEARDYVVDFGHGPLNDLRVQEDAVMAVIDEPASNGSHPLLAGTDPAPAAPSRATVAETADGKALAYLKMRLLSNFSGDPGHIATYRMALTDMLETVFHLRYVPPVEAWFKPIDPAEQNAAPARQSAPSWTGAPSATP